MGKYATLQYFTREFRDDLGDEPAILLARDKVTGEGLHPVGEPRIDWYELTQRDIDLDLAMMREAGVEDPVSPWRAGDWRVRVIFQVAEDAPVG